MNYVTLAFIVAAVLLVITGVFLIMRTQNMLKAVIALEIIEKAIACLLALAARLTGNNGLVQVFIVTIIIIEVVVTMVAVGLIINYFHNNDNIRLNNLNKLKG